MLNFFSRFIYHSHHPYEAREAMILTFNIYTADGLSAVTMVSVQARELPHVLESPHAQCP